MVRQRKAKPTTRMETVEVGALVVDAADGRPPDLSEHMRLLYIT